MFKTETIKKVKNNLLHAVKTYMAMDTKTIKMCISSGNIKIGRVLNVSLPPILTCGKACKGTCEHYCYDIKACNQYPNTVIDARARNLAILIKDRDEYFARIDAVCSRRRTNKYFRWHVAGDILDADYLDRMVKIAIAHPEFKFWTYTKQYHIVNEYVRTHGNDRHVAIPSNLTIMYSEWRGLEMVNPYGFPEFRCVFTSEGEKLDSETWTCPGNCDICKKVSRGCVNDETTQCEDH